MVRTIPRYLPALDLPARLSAFGRRDGVDGARELRSLLGLENWPYLHPVPSARAAIASTFSDLAALTPRRAVLLSAQICPIVPKILVELGFHVVAVDTEEDLPTPGGRRMLSAFAECGGTAGVAAVMVAPIYGYLPADIDALCEGLGDTACVLDLAQGALLARRSGLMARADAAIFSFSPGKGVDIGGGVLALRRPLASPTRARAAWRPALATLPAALALQALASTGLYRFAVPLIDRAIDDGKEDPAAALAGIGAVLPESVLGAFAARLERFAAEVGGARERAARLATRSAIERATLHGGALFDPGALHLRQIVRLADPARREDVLGRLRAMGIDAMPAGEPLPDSYLAADRVTVPPSSAGLPNARRFRADAIRLPFLGRLSEAEFTRLASALEMALDQRL